MLHTKSASLILLTLLSSILFSCGKTKKIEEITVDQGFKEYISAFTGGLISSRATIRVKLTSPYAQEVEAGAPVSNKVFSFEPKVKGSAFWLDNQTIEFKPEEPLENGRQYRASFALNNIIDVSDKYSTFPLTFRIIKQSFQVKVGELQQERQNPNTYTLEGTITAADFIENEKVQAHLDMVYEGKDVEVSWRHENASKKHVFYISNIERQEDDSQLNITWGGVDEKFIIRTFAVEIPGLSIFKLISARVVQQPSQLVLLTFSDPLLQSQNLDGLIRLEDEEKLKFSIEENQIKVFLPKRIVGSRELNINKAIKNAQRQRLAENKMQRLTFEATKPQVRLMGKGVIIPESEGLIFPFESINLNAVDVKVIKIYEDNVAQFLQINELDGEEELRRVGRVIARKKIDLVADNLIDYGRWNAFSFDLSELIKTEPGAIYKLEISFRKSYSLYPCSGEDDEAEADDENWDEAYSSNEQSYWDWSEDYYSGAYTYYSWGEKQDPCSPGYYQDKKVSRNVLASNIGIIAKAGNNNEMKVFVTDLLTTQAQGDVEIELLDYQQKSLSSAVTNAQGMASLSYDKPPFLLIAKSGSQRGYLKLSKGIALSLSKFDVGGKKYDKGIKGFIYGERGVWRPGDTIFLTFILEDKEQQLPAEHPLTFELIDPSGKTVKRIVKSAGINNFYHFETATAQDAPTGNWLAKVNIGGAVFTKVVKIETVKPNRLKINLTFNKDRLSKNDEDLQGKMKVKWLHGAIAKDLETIVNLSLLKTKTQFTSYGDFCFEDPTVEFKAFGKRIFSGQLDSNGEAEIVPQFELEGKMPGMLKAHFNTKVYEKGGNFSVGHTSIPYLPYNTYVGIKTPKGDKARGMLLTDKKHKIEVITLNANGEKVSQKGLVAKLYKVQWRWWWQSGNDNVGSYIESNEIRPILTKTFSTTNGFGAFDIEVNYPDWGRYIVKVEIPGGHSTGKILYIDWPGWAGRAQKENQGGASILAFSTDKKDYKVGETAKVIIPSSEGGRALITLEKGTKVIQAHWLDTEKGQSSFDFEVTEEMAPNVYLSVTMLQPHAQTANDLPIRMYGIVPIMVENPETRLTPLIQMPEELRPESEVNIAVSEKDGKAMTFTLAVVDEGLLDLTNYQTPNPWHTFYAREGLSVRTWDMYDMVLGAYGAKIEAAFAIGGDGEAGNDRRSKANRFKPVVKYFGPYVLKPGQTKHISFMMPNYLGAVKTMIVAANNGAYGSAEKVVPVKKPLMLFATLPRVLSPQEKVKLPVTLFAMDDKINKVKVKVKSNALLKIKEKDEKTIVFKTPGEQDFYFELESLDKLGIAKLELTAKSGREKASCSVELDIRVPNPPRIKTFSTICEPGRTWTQDFDLWGIEGTNAATLEISGMPPLNIDKRLKFLIRYPYGCVEQTTSSVFPQLYLGELLNLEAAALNNIQKNISKGIERLSLLQIGNGGFAYWPGSNAANEWGTNYAGHFMIEAEEKGYTLPPQMKSKWINFQQDQANNWSPHNERYRDDGFTQAYRLFTLALADVANLGEMNRLREYEKLGTQARHFLSMAYVYAGKKEVAMQLIAGAEKEKTNLYTHTYGSKERNMAILLEGFLKLKMYDAAMPVIKEISAALNSSAWMSTQTTAFCLRAMAQAAEIFKASLQDFKYSYTLNTLASKKVLSTHLVNQYALKISDAKVSNILKVENQSEFPFYINLAVEGTPLVDDFEKEEKNIAMNVVYKDLDGRPLDHQNIKQGTDFKVEITVRNTSGSLSYENMALSAMFPSGWEISNTRLYGEGSVHMIDIPSYQDIRDDRVDFFFDLSRHEKKTFVVLLNASYIGEYNMPSISCSAMYDNTVRARVPGGKVKVVKP